MSKEKTRLRALALVVLALATIPVLKQTSGMNAPFIAFLLLPGVWAIALSLLTRADLLRKIALLCSSVLFSLAVLETCMYYVARPRIIITRTVPAAWRRNVTDIGSLPVSGTPIQFKEFLDGRLIGDVTYRIDANGLREIPEALQGRGHKVAFFGCSFMFGHGVEDDETLPYYFVQAARGSFEGFNFAGEGWGPHQMLREIESGFVGRVAGAPDLAIYEAIPDHLRRVAGRAPWEDGPEYELCRGGEACYKGPFHSAYYAACRHWLDKSWTVKFIDNYFVKLSRPADLPLFLAVLRKTRSMLEKNGTRFVIILWDQNELAKTMMRTLRANHFDVIALSSIVSESDQMGRPVIQLDRHPSPATNKAIATYLWDQIGEEVVAGHSKATAKFATGNFRPITR